MRTLKHTRPLLTLITALSGILAWTAKAQTESPGPGHEHQQLAVWVGDWDYTGVQHETPFGPKGKFSGKMLKRFVLNGYFLETNWKEDEQGVTKGLAGKEIHTYDASKQQYVTYAFMSDGTTSMAIDTYDGNIYRAESTVTDRTGGRAHVKGIWTIAESGNQFTAELELSLDGRKTWMPWFELTATKVKD